MSKNERYIRAQNKANPGGESLVFDLDSCERWVGETYRSDFNPEVGFYVFWHRDRLVRGDQGEFFLVTSRSYLTPDELAEPEHSYRVVEAREAADWLVDNDLELPDDLRSIMADKIVGQHQPYLGLSIRGNTVLRGESEASFGGKGRPLELVEHLLAVGERGKEKAKLRDDLYGSGGVSENAIDQLRSSANKHLEEIGVEISANGYGIWKLESL